MEDWISAGCRDDLQRAEVVRLWRESIWRKQTSRIITFAGSDGLLKDIELRPAGLPGGGMVLLVQDVTDENRAEEVLRATEAKFRALVHENPLPVVMTDRSGAVFEANAAAESLLGRTRAELRRMTLDQWIAPGGLSERASALREMAHRGDLSANVNVEVRHREGRTIPAALRVAIVPDAQGMPAAAVQFFRPLEAPSKTTFTGLAEEPAPPVSKPLPPPGTVLLATDSQGRVSEWSSAAEECFGVSQEGAIGRGLHTFFRPSDATGFYQELSQLKPEGSPGGVERDYFHPVNGRTRGRFDILPREEGSLSVVIESHPVSEEPQPEPKAAPSASAAGAVASAEARPTPSDLARERLLLGETHHRVKNHLQIITSMLNLQLSTMNDQSAREALRSSQNRVRSVAALHQHLYSLAVGEAGTFTEFATGLIRQLRECYEVAEDRVALELDIPGQPVPEEWLMPLALSLNEMVSNAFKHAYPDGRGGRMKVALKWDHEHVELLVQDDGIGLPPDFDDHRSSGLGLKILRVFAGQLGGEIVVSSEPDKGAAFRLRFPLGTGEG
jgi:PAS domain S-box-containing protein